MYIVAKINIFLFLSSFIFQKRPHSRADQPWVFCYKATRFLESGTVRSNYWIKTQNSGTIPAFPFIWQV